MQNVISFSSKQYHPTHNQSYLLVEHDVIVKFAVNWLCTCGDSFSTSQVPAPFAQLTSNTNNSNQFNEQHLIFKSVSMLCRNLFA